jgi:predicted acyltransferase
MKGKQITRWFLLIVTIIVIIFDIWVISKHGKSSSISWVMISELKRDYPLANDALWFTLGHIFWRMKTPDGESEDK